MGFKKIVKSLGFAPMKWAVLFTKVNFIGQADFVLASTLKHNRSPKFTPLNISFRNLFVTTCPKFILRYLLFYVFLLFRIDLKQFNGAGGEILKRH